MSRKLHWIECGVIIFAFAAPAACMGVPFAIGSNGLVLGSLICLITTVASMCGAMMLFEVCQQYPDAQQLSDLGLAVFGRKGQIAVGILQLGNFLLFLPIALLTCADGLQALWTGMGKGIEMYILVVAGVCHLTTQFRDLGNTAPLAYFSIIGVWVIGVLLVIFVCKHENPEKQIAVYFGNPQIDTRAGLYNCFLGLTTAAWGYVPSFLTTELVSSMTCPSHFKRAVILSGVLNIIFYIGLGVTVTLRWGSNLPDPVNISKVWLAHADDPLARIMALLLLIVNIISYSLDSIPLVRNFQRIWFPNFRDDCSPFSTLVYFGISLPSFGFALLLALTMDNLFLMLAWGTCLTVPAVTQIVPSVLYAAHRRRQCPSSSVDDQPIRGLDEDGLRTPAGNATGWTYKQQVMVMFTFLYGGLNFIICLLAAIGKSLVVTI
jgi:amino acid permease